MQRVSNNKEMSFLVEDIEAVLEMNRLLEKENQELKHEIAKLKSQISSLKAHDIERKSILWKKLQYPINNNNSNNVTSNKDQGSVHEQKKQVISNHHEKPSASASPSPPLPLPPPSMSKVVISPPPPPPMPSKSMMGSKLAVRRAPQVIEFYRYLNKRNARVEHRGNVTGGSIEGNNEKNPRDMIGEIVNKSMYHSAVKSDVEMQKEFINCTIRDIETTIFKDITEVEAFVKHLDEELSCLVDERAVLKHFPHWPERKADALREAACCYRDLKKLEFEVLSYKDNPKQPLPQTLRRLQMLQDRLEKMIENIEKTREGTCKRYKDLHIPWDWMLDTGFLGQMKLNSLMVAREYMKRIIKELQSLKLSSNPEDILHQGARFAYRVHQLVGGFDIDTEQVFEELKQIHTTKFSHSNN